MKLKLFTLASILLLTVYLSAGTGNQCQKIIVDTIKEQTFMKTDNGQTRVTTTYERDCAMGGNDCCERGTFTSSIII